LRTAWSVLTVMLGSFPRHGVLRNNLDTLASMTVVRVT
jgi:hypothetical protein